MLWFYCFLQSNSTTKRTINFTGFLPTLGARMSVEFYAGKAALLTVALDILLPDKEVGEVIRSRRN